jgi:hypothetical protein
MLESNCICVNDLCILIVYVQLCIVIGILYFEIRRYFLSVGSDSENLSVNTKGFHSSNHNKNIELKFNHTHTNTHTQT